MTFDWKKNYIFQQESRLFNANLPNKFFIGKKKVQKFHIYQPWSSKIEKELMFLLKKKLEESSQVFIPFKDINGQSYNIKEENLKVLCNQVKNSRGETQLVMSNGHTIHILNVVELGKFGDAKVESLDCFNVDKNDLGVIVSDLYVYHANHVQDKQKTINILNNFVLREKETCVFGEVKAAGHTWRQKWADKNRAFTYNYFMKTCELKEHVYQDGWEELSLTSRHELVQFELLRQDYGQLEGLEQWIVHRDSFQCYKRALLHELNSIYYYPLLNALNEFGFFKEMVQEMIRNQSSSDFNKLLKEMTSTDSSEMTCLKDFFTLIDGSKSFFYSLKNQISKMFHREEYLWIENFLAYQQSLVDSFVCKNLRERIETLMVFEVWIIESEKHIDDFPRVELESLNLKLSQLLKMMSSNDPEENIFFSLLEEKTEKSLTKRSFSDEVAGLQILTKKYLAS